MAGDIAIGSGGRPWFKGVLCKGWVVVCGVVHTPICKCLGRGFFEYSIQQNTSFAHTQNSIQKSILREEHTPLWDQSTPPKTRSMWVTVGVCATWYILNGEESVEKMQNSPLQRRICCGDGQTTSAATTYMSVASTMMLSFRFGSQ